MWQKSCINNVHFAKSVKNMQWNCMRVKNSMKIVHKLLISNGFHSFSFCFGVFSHLEVFAYAWREFYAIDVCCCSFIISKWLCYASMSINLYAFTKITSKLSVSLTIVSFIANLLAQPMNTFTLVTSNKKCIAFCPKYQKNLPSFSNASLVDMNLLKSEIIHYCIQHLQGVIKCG